MGCCATCLASCAASSCCKAINCCAPSSNRTAFSYAFLTLLATIVAAILQHFGDNDIFGSTSLCSLFGDTWNDNCNGNASPFRILAVLSWFYVIHMIMTAVWSSFHKSFWLIKIICYCIVVILMYLVPNKVFEGYAVFAIICASIFIVLQIVIFINMCYDWNETWVSRNWLAQTIGVTVLMYVVAGILYGVAFSRYGMNGCSLNQAMLSCSIIASFILTILSIYAAHGAILPSAGVTLYLSWILFSGLSFTEDKNCNKMEANSYMIVVSVCIMSVSVGFFCLKNSKQEEEENSVDNEENNNNGDKVEEPLDLENGDNDESKEKEEEIENMNTEEFEARTSLVKEAQNRNLRFYVLMFFGVMYLMMIITQWSTDANETAGNVSKEVVTANLVAHWGVVCLYFVTLVAPICCPNRFVYDEESD